MCLIAFAWKADPERPLVLIANRDELHDRASAPLAFWPDHPELCAGRDLREGGTWLGVHRSGRLAAVTNVRDARDSQPRPRSRGALTTDFLVGRQTAAEFAHDRSGAADEYGGYNLLLWDGAELVYASNRPRPTQRLVTAGLHGLSNAQLDTPWPKVVHARAQLQGWISQPAPSADSLFAAMADRRVPPDDELPDTGVGLDTERLLSTAFILRPGYGTRCTTWLQIGADGAVTLRERRFDGEGRPAGDTALDFNLIGWPR